MRDAMGKSCRAPGGVCRGTPEFDDAKLLAHKAFGAAHRLARDLRRGRRGALGAERTDWMDAGLILANAPASLAGGADAPAQTSADDADAFAAHLDADAQARPVARKPAAKADDNEYDKNKDDDKDDRSAPPPSWSLTSPTAPAVVRENGAPAVQEIALNGVSPQGAPANAVPATPTPDADAELANAAGATADAQGIEAATGNAAAQAKAQAGQGEESPRGAGKTRGNKGDSEAPEAAKRSNPRNTASAEAAQAGAKSDAQGPAAPAASAPAKSADTTAQPVATGEAAAVTLEARRAAEAAPQAVHRPPTVAATVAQHIIRRFDGKSTTIDVRLDPAELGRVSVKLDVGADARVTAVVAADNPSTLQDLMRSSRELERALESAGLELTQNGLSFDLSGGRNDDRTSSSAGLPSSAIAAADTTRSETTTPTTRPFGLESWRGVRVDMTV